MYLIPKILAQKGEIQGGVYHTPPPGFHVILREPVPVGLKTRSNFEASFNPFLLKIDAFTVYDFYYYGVRLLMV